MLGENTAEGRKKMQHDIDVTHQSFADFVKNHRPDIDINEVATGEHWLAMQALELKLVDRLATSDEIILEAPAGTVVVFNSHVWHGGTINQTDQPRRAIHSYFCARDQPQQTAQKKLIRQDTLDRISDEARWLLDV